MADRSRAVHHMINRSEQKKRHTRKDQGLSLTSQGWYNIWSQGHTKKRAYIESYKICFWPLKGGTPSDFRPRKRTTWWNVDNVVICPYWLKLLGVTWSGSMLYYYKSSEFLIVVFLVKWASMPGWVRSARVRKVRWQQLWNVMEKGIYLCTFVEHTNTPYHWYKYRQQCPIWGNISDANTMSKAHSKSGATESIKPMLNITTPLLLLKA